MAEIEEAAWEGVVLYSKSRRAVARALDCSHNTISAAIERIRQKHAEDIPPTRELQLIEALARNRHLRGQLATRIQNREVEAIREARYLDEQYATYLGLLGNARLEVSGPGGGPITFAQVPNEEKMEALRLAVLEGQRRLKAVEAEGRVVKPKALPAKPAAKKPAPKKPAAKKPAPKGQAKGSKRASKSKVKQADQPERKTAARTSAGGT